VRLTPAGELACLRIIRRHRILEIFLAKVLGYEWDQVHEEAERLEHAVSDHLIERLARLLDDPERDPHGSAIPTAEGEMDAAVYPTLADMAPGETGRVVEVRVQEAEQLRYLGSLNLRLGARVEVVEHAPFGGPISLSVNGVPRVLSRALAEQVRIAPAADVDRAHPSSPGQPRPSAGKASTDGAERQPSFKG
jgi:DtxR family Mn-dependent transcriptional regulator